MPLLITPLSLDILITDIATVLHFSGPEDRKYQKQYNTHNIMADVEDSMFPQEQYFRPNFHSDTGVEPPGRTMAGSEEIEKK